MQCTYIWLYTSIKRLTEVPSLLQQLRLQLRETLQICDSFLFDIKMIKNF